MAIIKCPECDKEISDQSRKCIHCGYPLKRKKSNGNSSKITIIIIAVLLVLFAIIVGFLVIFFTRDKYIETSIEKEVQLEMLDVVGIDYKEAISLLENEGYNHISVKEGVFSDYEKNIIYKQEIPAGALIQEDDEIVLFYSKAKALELLDVVGMNVNEAQKLLKEKGFENIGTRSNGYSDEDNKDLVLSVSAAGGKLVGDKVKTDSEITLYYSMGNRTMPKVIGLELENADNILRKLKIKYKVVYEISDEQVGTVIRQSLDEGEMVLSKDNIVLTIAQKEKQKAVKQKPIPEPTPVDTPSVEITPPSAEATPPALPSESGEVEDSSGFSFASDVFAIEQLGIKVTFKGVDDPAGMLESSYIALKFMVENYTGGECRVLVKNISINGCSLTALGAFDIQNEGKALVKCSVHKDRLAEYEITSVDTVSANVWIKNIGTTDSFTINAR